MVLADLGRKITHALRSLSNATLINEDVSLTLTFFCNDAISDSHYRTNCGLKTLPSPAKFMLSIMSLALMLFTFCTCVLSLL